MPSVFRDGSQNASETARSYSFNINVTKIKGF